VRGSPRSARLWVVCEKYRELVAEMHEGRLDLAMLRDRRHALLQEAAAVFEHVAPGIATPSRSRGGRWARAPARR